MDSKARYATVSFLLIAAACGASALAFFAAIDLFATTELSGSAHRLGAAPQAVKLLSSDLAGVNVRSVSEGNFALAAEGVAENEEWIETTGAVNMRSGPSSANPAIRVQLEGAQLRVATRDGNWIQVVEPKTGQEGWVYDRLVKPVEPISRRAEVAGADRQ